MPGVISPQNLLQAILVEEEERSRARMAVEAPKYDFFGPDCDCPPEVRFPSTECDCPPETKDDGRCTLGHLAKGCRVHQRARLKQMPPSGDWLVWLLLMGRGYGKSRVGSEWTIDLAKNGPENCRIAIVGQQASDVRDIMIEGESGILAKSPPWFRPRYLWSKRRLEWPNGAIGLCYSSEEPGQFRGPQFHGSWCLSGKTKVLMGDGSEKRLSSVEVNEMVMTRYGPRKVTASAMTRRKAEVFAVDVLGGRTIIGTSDHPVFVDGLGFVPIGSLSRGMQVCVASVSSGVDELGISMQADGITRPESVFTAKSGSRSMGRSRPVMISTTRTTTNTTTGSKTSKCLLDPSTARFIVNPSSVPTAKRLGLIPWRLVLGMRKLASRFLFCVSSVVKRITVARLSRLGSVRPLASRPQGAGHSGEKDGSASNAERSILQRNGFKSIAQRSAIWPLVFCAARENFETWYVPSAELRSGASDPMRVSASTRVLYFFMRPIVSVRKSAKPIDVYDISVDGAREFFADGILVHNCDEIAKWSYVEECWDNLQFGLRLAGDGTWVPRVCGTTTPLPIPLVKRLRKDPDTVVVTGSSYENVNNLAKSAIAKIKKQYEGTRLGRQEIHAEVLEDNPHALWSTALLDMHRVSATDVPDLARVVVAIDPSVNDPETVMDESRAAEAGITVGGIDGDRVGYLLEDCSMRGKPVEWARAAISAYHRRKADCIVAEGNNGGAMITSLINTLDPTVPVIIVHASRGKYTRAEPVASLDEQGRIHHAGFFPVLEEQMVTWMPGMASPDRLDSRVWLFTNLMLDGAPLDAGDTPWGEEWRGS